MLWSADVPEQTGILERMAIDPALGYMVFATAFLAGVAVLAGLIRRDVLALREPLVAAKLVVAVLAAVLLAHVTQTSVDAFGWHELTWGRPDGLFRLPLYVFALAYGPTPGVVAALGYLGVDALGWTPEGGGPVLPVELAVLGWLAIFPSPFRHRWAGPVDALAAYVLAWGTTGLTLLAVRDDLSIAGITNQHAGMAAGAAVAALALASLGPATYRRLFPESRVHTGREDGAVTP